MPAIGITGGVATGKSTFCDCLRELLPSAKFFNADHAARELVDLDSGVKTEIEREFGAETFSGSGHLNREQLRAIVFSDPAKRRALEKILHPRIRSRWSAEAQTYRNSSNFFFADIPLLYETGGEKLCDRVVAVACTPGIQLARLLQRGSIGRGEAEKMIASQMPLNEKLSRADHVAWNDGERSTLLEQAGFLVDLWRTETWTKK